MDISHVKGVVEEGSSPVRKSRAVLLLFSQLKLCVTLLTYSHDCEINSGLLSLHSIDIDAKQHICSRIL